jgi:hypothetical protein
MKSIKLSSSLVAIGIVTFSFSYSASAFTNCAALSTEVQQLLSSTRIAIGNACRVDAVNQKERVEKYNIYMELNNKLNDAFNDYAVNCTENPTKSKARGYSYEYTITNSTISNLYEQLRKEARKITRLPTTGYIHCGNEKISRDHNNQQNNTKPVSTSTIVDPMAVMDTGTDMLPTEF